MPGEAGPIGDIVSITRGSTSVIEMPDQHGLEDGTRVRLRSGASTKLCYIKSKGSSGNTFSAYSDPEMKQPADLQPISSGATVERLNDEDWAVVAGINYYPGFSNLQGPVLDTTLFKDWALTRGFVPDDQLNHIKSPEAAPPDVYSAEPTREKIDDAFRRLIRAAEPKRFHRLGRRLYIFFSGHGIVATGDRTPDYRGAALLMANADSNSLVLHVGARAAAEWFRAHGIFDEVILFTDCCRDQEDNISPSDLIVPPWKALRPEGRFFYAFPAMLGSKAWEKPLDKYGRVRGVFGYVITEALNNPKLYDDKGQLTGSALESHLYKTIPTLNNRQDPIIDYPHDNKPEIIIAKWFPRAKQPVEIRFDPPCPGCTAELFQGNNLRDPIDTHSIDNNPWTGEWQTGWLYKVAVSGTTRSQMFEITGTEEVQIVKV